MTNRYLLYFSSLLKDFNFDQDISLIIEISKIINFI